MGRITPTLRQLYEETISKLKMELQAALVDLGHKSAFDLLLKYVSNLVFHNFGKMRFRAYSLLSSWTQAGSFVIMGDLFFSPKTDIAHLEKAFRILRQIKPKNGFRDYALLVMSRDSHEHKSLATNSWK